MKNSYISESGRLTYDELEAASILNKISNSRYQEVFDSFDHSFLLAVLQNYGSGKRFLKWIQILIKNQEPCVVNSCKIL